MQRVKLVAVQAIRAEGLPVVTAARFVGENESTNIHIPEEIERLIQE